MRILKFKIENYRAIESIKLDLNYSINPIIGINEAGKTSVLKAILTFDKSRDRYNKGKHLDFKNNYAIKQRDCQISAHISLDNKEIDELVRSLNLKTDSEDYKIISKLDSEYKFILKRELSKEKRPFTTELEGISKSAHRNLTKFLVKNLPYILYFDDFADRVPEEIVFPDDYTETGKIGRYKFREWNEIIQEIFKRSDTEGIRDNESEIPLVSYLKVVDEDTKEDILSDVQDTLNKEVIEEWKRIKKSGGKFC